MAIHARKSTLAQVALREQRESEFGNPNCEAPSNILWGGPVLCSPISENLFCLHTGGLQQRGDDAESWHVLGD